MFYKLIPVVIYAVFCSLVAAVLVRFFEVTEAVVRIYAIIVVVGALVLPLWKPLNKEMVDFLYYFFAIVVAWQLFIFYEPRRQATLTLVEHSNTEAQIARVKDSQTRRGAILDDPAAFLKAIRQGAEYRYVGLDNRKSYECQRVQNLDMQARNAEIAQKHGEAAAFRMEQANAQSTCNQLTFRLTQKEWPLIKKINTTSTLMAHREWIRSAGIDISLQGSSVSLAEATDDLYSKTVVPGVDETAAIESQRVALERETVRLRDRVQDLIRKESESDLELRKKAAAAAGKFVEVFWPFMLICLLGMKLARTDHVGLIIASLDGD